MAKAAHLALVASDFDAELEALIEAPRARRRRLKAREANRKVKEIDRSASVSKLERAAKRLKTVRASERVLSVPQWNMDKAVEAMKHAGVSGVVTNLCGTRKQKVVSRKP
jgi:hypothetical protein